MTGEFSSAAAELKVSVILPVYDVAPYLDRCLQSLINQTLRDIEIILIDDASLDGSAEICDAYARLDPRIKVVRHAVTTGQGRARNEGIELARGRFVGFVDPDDRVDADFFEKLHDCALKHSVHVAKASLREVSSDGRIIRVSRLNQLIRKGMKKGRSLLLLFNHEHCTAIYDRHFLMENNIRYADIRNGEDDIFLLQAAYHANGISLTDKTNYHYIRRNDSLVSVRDLSYYEGYLNFFDRYMAFLNSHPMSESDYRALFEKLIEALRVRYRQLQDSGDYPDFRKDFILHVFKGSLEYKYDLKDLLESFFPAAGIRYHFMLMADIIVKRLW